ncbi:aspartyl/asparaginyl beta-hydroxylase domain-containing protein [Legionella cardiaca]|uniref:Aspartyl/asparaginyl beta-hydroxylase domain-containing protein n=1 Tax=Legionella cardiaca TaxID=1071983 RepID=A0ABY8ASR7_9GAMM|nr:aspartyl/asparaginyl beta-hydroxylase domain-containing protein [Legionella cardiaca]WED43514.1 aspartyl/asparaginyl beta-hydroxylase domain-containing protein [Legionella cardiaca]
MTSKILGKLSFNDELLQNDLNTIAQFPELNEEYDEFGIGYWKNHSLWNECGDFTNTQYRDYITPIKITELGKKLPYITRMVEENFDLTHLKMVRARNLINGFVIPHKDFVELKQRKTHYLRVFIPLENNSDSYHSDEKSVFQMQKGEVWRLDASIVHAAANFGTDSRVHICLDFQFPEERVPE